MPGWKLVQKRATRKWKSNEGLRTWASENGIEDADILTEPKLKNPAQVERIVGKKNLPSELIESVSIGFNLARSDSATPAAAITSAADDFPLID